MRTFKVAPRNFTSQIYNKRQHWTFWTVICRNHAIECERTIHSIYPMNVLRGLCVSMYWCSHISDSTGFPICIRSSSHLLIRRKPVAQRWQKKGGLSFSCTLMLIYVKTGVFLHKNVALCSFMVLLVPLKLVFVCYILSFINHTWFIKGRLIRQNSILSVCICLATVLYKEPTVLVSCHVLSSSL